MRAGGTGTERVRWVFGVEKTIGSVALPVRATLSSVSEVVIGRPHGLRLDAVDVAEEFLVAHLVLRDVTATKSIYGDYAARFGALLHYFEGLADHWRGWDGVKSYDSLEGDLRLEATHDGHVHLRVRLRNHIDPTDWIVEGEVTIDAGEELSRIVSDLRAALR
jgi:hypothetical protein